VIEKIEPKAKSVLDVGGGRGYVCRILENHGIPAVAMDISNYCKMTRATDSFVLHDATKIPWPFKDKEHDLCVSINFLEHLHEKQIEPVIREMMRVSVRGLHGIHTTDPPYPELDADRDKSHHSMHEKKYWEDLFKRINPEYTVIVEHPRLIEYAKPELQPPVSLAPSSPDVLMKLNLGSFLDCFYYGWINCDVLDLTTFCQSQAYSFAQVDLSKPFPWKDGEADILFSSHLLEHFSRDEGRSFLSECYRVLKPGGIIRISVPDAKKLAQQYVDGGIMEQRFINVGVERARDDAEAFYEVLLAHHKTVYDEAALRGLLESVGFKDVSKVSAFESRSDTIRTQTINTYPDLSLVTEATR
jgi:predicted SAM-dependent methyltransferase